jgi:hypothetical protein
MIVVEIEIDGKKLALTKKVLIVTALYAQLTNSKASRQLVGETTLIDLARGLGINDMDRLRLAAAAFDNMLAERYSLLERNGGVRR